MLKKSLLWEAAVLLTAVILIFAGCEGPAGPAGQQGDSGQVGPSEIGDITVGIEIKEPDVILPEGFTYPDGAKVVAGDATDIALAFNGGIFVADTSDASGQAVAGAGSTGTGTGYVYAQNGVDQVLWTGPGTKGASSSLGAISVPPGKTLFIAAPLVIDSDASSNGVFTGISVSDQGLLPSTTASIQYAEGGAKIDGTNKGTLVVLAGAEITDAAATGPGTFTVGGNLEIHQGGVVAFTVGTPIKTTAGSSARVFGQLSSATTALTINGGLSIEGGGRVSSGTNRSSFAEVAIKDAGRLSVGSGDADFLGKVSVAETAAVILGGAIFINDEFALNGTLNADGNGVTLAANTASHLKVSSTGSIDATSWGQFKLGSKTADAEVLLAALANDTASDDNNHITIAAAAGKPIYLGVGGVATDSYEDFVALLGSADLHLPKVTYTGGNPVDPAPLKVTADNYGEITGTVTALGDITVESGGALTLGSNALANAGTVTIVGEGRPAIATFGTTSGVAVSTPFSAAAATFGTALTGLTIGDINGTKTDVTLATATLAGAKTVDELTDTKNTIITVNKGASLTLSAAVNPGGNIVLAAGDEAKAGGKLTVGSGATFANLYSLTIGAGASFDGGTSDITFENLVKLTVNGTLKVAASTAIAGINSATGFKRLQTTLDGDGNDVGGSGKAVFANWRVTASHHHAFDQILGIKDVTVATVTGVSDFSADKTSDATPSTAEDASLTVTNITGSTGNTGITIPSGGLTIDRDLYLQYDVGGGTALASLITGSATAADNVVTINEKKGIYVYNIDSTKTDYAESRTLVLGGPSQATAKFTVPTASSKLTANSDKGIDVTVGALTVSPTYTLQVPGVLNTVGVNVGKSATAVKLATGTILNNVTLTSGPDTADGTGTVVVKGKLTITADSTIGLTIPTLATDTRRNKLELANGAQLIVTGSAKLTMPGAEFSTGTIKGLGASSSITATKQTQTIPSVTGTEYETALFSGSFKAWGASVLKGVATKILAIDDAGTITLGESGYDYVELSKGAKLYGANTFTAGSGAAPTITLVSGILLNGTVKTLGNGVLDLDVATLQAPNALAFTGAVDDTGLISGTLALNDDSVLTIDSSGTFTVGTATVGATLDIGSNTGKVVFSAITSKLEVETANSLTDNVSHFKFGSHDFSSRLTSGDAVDTVYKDYSGGVETGPATSNDIFIGGTKSSMPKPDDPSTTIDADATTGTGSVLTLPSGKPTITGTVAGNTITSTSKVYLGK